MPRWAYCAAALNLVAAVIVADAWSAADPPARRVLPSQPSRSGAIDAAPDALPISSVLARSRALRADAIPTIGTLNAPDTVWVGYSAAYAGSNYWSIGRGPARPQKSSGGIWDWEFPVHGDSLQGWWPIRRAYSIGGVSAPTDDQRSWWGLDFGNQSNYVINQGPPYRRTFGVVGVWHRDQGSALGGGVTWSPLAGTASAWCGLRRHGDNSVIDPQTGNPFNQDALQFNGEKSPLAGGTSRNFPGYASQWDQMLYRDISIVGAPGPNLTVSFKLRTRMSRGNDTAPLTRIGWFDKDPLSLAAGNFISSSAAGAAAPVDSFMVYVGCPVGDATGAEWMGSDGYMHQVFDPARRWFAEVIRANEFGKYRELYSVSGDTSVTVTCGVALSSLQPVCGNKLRLVLRVKTNRGFDDLDSGESGYSSGGAGAAQVDDVTINVGSGPVLIGNFEAASSIDNSPLVSPLTAWKSTGKPPAIFGHTDEMTNLIFQPQDPSACNISGTVISMGDHDLGESAGGSYGTAEQERMDGVFSPTINLASGGSGQFNNMGIDADLTSGTDDIYVRYEIYAGIFDLLNSGNAWTIGVQSYPAAQAGSGTPCWGDLYVPPVQYFESVQKCLTNVQGLRDLGVIHTSNPSGMPDSIRIFLGKQQQCFRFNVTTECGSTLGAYFDNTTVGFTTKSLDLCNLSFTWEPGAAIHMVRPMSWWPNTELNRMRPGDVIAFSLLAEDKDYLRHTCSGCQGEKSVVSGLYEDLVAYDWSLRRGSKDGRIVGVDNVRGSTILYQMPRCGDWRPGPLRDTLEVLIGNVPNSGMCDEWWGSVPRAIITMSGCDSSSIQVSIDLQMQPGPLDQIAFGGGQNVCVPSEPEWLPETPISVTQIQQTEPPDDFCPDYVTLLSVTAGDLDRYALTCTSQNSGCLEPQPETRSTIDPLHYTWELVGGSGSFPLGTDGPAVALRKSKSEDSWVECRITDSHTQFTDGGQPRVVLRRVIKGQPPRAFVGIGNHNLGYMPNPIKLVDAIKEAELAADNYRQAGYEVKLSPFTTPDTINAVLGSPCYQAIWVNGHGDEGAVQINGPGPELHYFTCFDVEFWNHHICPNPFIREIVALGCRTYSGCWDLGMVCGRAYTFPYDLVVGAEGSRLGRRPLDWERDEHKPIRAHDLRLE